MARQRRDAAARWRGGLPVDNIAVDTLTKEARSRRSEELRLAKRAGDGRAGSKRRRQPREQPERR